MTLTARTRTGRPARPRRLRAPLLLGSLTNARLQPNLSQPTGKATTT